MCYTDHCGDDVADRTLSKAITDEGIPTTRVTDDKGPQSKDRDDRQNMVIKELSQFSDSIFLNN